MSFYSELALDVDELLAELGQKLVVTNIELGEADPETGIVPQQKVSFETVAVLLDYDYRNFGETLVPYQATSSSDKRIICSAARAINVNDLLFIDGVYYKAYVIKSVNPAGVRVVYDIWAQK